MSSDKQYVLDTMRRAGLSAAENVQARSPEMTGTELYAVEDYIPDFQAAKAIQNMLTRPAGQTDGFVCRSSAGRIVRLIQAYDSETYPQEPEDLPAQWRFVWSTDPTKALPFIELATSPYNTDDCCTDAGHVWRSGQDNNTWRPGTVGIKWTDLGTIEDVMSGGGNTEPEEPEPEPVEPDPSPEPEPKPEPEPEKPESGGDDVTTAERGMEYVYGQKYLDPEDGQIYVCKRQGEAEGGKITLYYLPHELIGQYFELCA